MTLPYTYAGTNGFNAKNLTYGFGIQNRRHNREEAGRLNATDADIEYAVAQQVFTSRFTWEGESIRHCPQGYIENLLFMYGFCVAYMDARRGLVILPANISGYSYMNTPNRFIAIGRDISKDLSLEDCVVIQDNALWRPPSVLATRKSGLVADAGRAIEVYMDGMKQPTTIVTTDKKAQTAENIARAKVGNEPYLIIESKSAGEEEKPCVTFHNNAHNGSDLQALIAAKQNLSNEMLSKMGVSASSVHKSQYVSTEEMDRQDVHIELLHKQALDFRLEAIDRINSRFNADLSLVDNMETADPEQEEQESEQNDL